MQQVCTLIRTAPVTCSGICHSTISKGPFGRGTYTTRIVAMIPAPFCRPRSGAVPVSASAAFAKTLNPQLFENRDSRFDFLFCFDGRQINAALQPDGFEDDASRDAPFLADEHRARPCVRRPVLQRQTAIQGVAPV
jgi:hypothetical protein